MGGDDELRAVVDEALHEDEHAHLAHRGERGLGLVEDVEAVAVEAVGEQGEEGFAVGLFVEGAVAVPAHSKFFNFSCDIEEAFGSKEVAFFDAAKRFIEH